MSEGYFHNGTNWVDRFGRPAPFARAAEPFEFRNGGRHIHAARPLRHAGKDFRAGALLGTIEHTRDGAAVLREWDGKISRLKR
jgi:hypothetical protein